MKTKDILLELRNKAGISQDELAEKVYVTRQAVSRWENGETTPNTETLKLLSKPFSVSINTLLSSPRQLICQCCGMPLEDSNISKETDDIFNKEYCKWCYADSEYTYKNMDDLIEFCAEHMAKENFLDDGAIYLGNHLECEFEYLYKKIYPPRILFCPNSGSEIVIFVRRYLREINCL